MSDDPAQQSEIRRDTSHAGLGERARHLVEGLRARLSVNDELCDQWVVGDRDLVACLDPGVNPDPGR